MKARNWPPTEFRLSDYRNTHPSSQNHTGRLVIEALAAAGVA